MQAIESFARDGEVDEWIGIFGDGMAQIGGQRKENADRIYGAGRDHNEFAPGARLLPQLKNFVERFRRLRGELSQKVGAIRRDLRCGIHWQGPEAVRVTVGFRRGSDGIAPKAGVFTRAEKRVQVYQHIVGGGKSYERMIHDNQIVAIEILFNRGFAEFTQSAAIPMDLSSGMGILVLRSAFQQRSVATRVVPGQSF